LKKTAEKQIKDLLAKHAFPPVKVVIPILEKAGRGEQELAAQIYNTYATLAEGTTRILGLRDKDMRTVAKVFEILLSLEGLRLQPVELSESRFSFNLQDCPMVHVGKNVSFDVKSKFCDLICTAGSRGLIDTILGSQKRGTCTWDKALIRGAGKCTTTFELVKPK